LPSTSLNIGTILILNWKINYNLEEEEVKRALTQEYDDEINNLELNIDEYSPKCNFFVLQTKEVDVVLGNSWLKSIGTFTMNVDKKYIEFEHLTNKIML
jgi:hypothetical protein